MEQLKVDEEFRTIIPPLTAEEYAKTQGLVFEELED